MKTFPCQLSEKTWRLNTSPLLRSRSRGKESLPLDFPAPVSPNSCCDLTGTKNNAPDIFQELFLWSKKENTKDKITIANQ